MEGRFSQGLGGRGAVEWVGGGDNVKKRKLSHKKHIVPQIYPYLPAWPRIAEGHRTGHLTLCVRAQSCSV